MNLRHRIVAAVTAAATLTPLARAADWPGFRGPNHDGISAETVAWPKTVKPVFKVPVGEGFGTMAVAGNKVFLTAEGGGQEALLALDANTGERKWHHVLGRSIYEQQGGNGPRTTPATDGKLVVAYSTHLNLVACDAETGKVAWQHDVQAEFNGRSQMTGGIQKWGNASSPVIDGDRVFVYGGGAGSTFLAFDKATGKLAWKAGDEKITHASPTVATIHGVRQVIFFCQSGLVSVDAATGAELWKFPHKYNVSTASTPVVGGKDNDVVYCSAGYKVGAAAAKIAKDADKFTATALWRNTDEHELANHWTSCVYKDGFLYGIFGFKQYGQAPLKCVNLESGKVMWEKPGFGPGGTVLAGDTLIATGDKGQVAFVKATPEGYHATGGANLVEGKVWNAAIVANGKLYVRSTKQNGNSKEQGWLVCLDVAGK
jgi:outer membrane protein assembly factor BamB